MGGTQAPGRRRPAGEAGALTPTDPAARGGRVTAYADTNLFVGLFAEPTHALHGPALDLFRRVADGALTLVVVPLVVAELVYVCSSTLRWTRSVVAERLSALIEADGLTVREQPTIRLSLELYRLHRRLDFADAYLAAAALGPGPTLIASFDRDLDAIAGVTRLSG